MLVDLEIESYQEILQDKDQLKEIKKIKFVSVDTILNLVPGEKSEGDVSIKVDARMIESGEFMSAKMKGVVTLDDQTGFTV